MKIPYLPYTVNPSPLFPGGVLYEPQVPLGVIGPSGVGLFTALLDTGADHCILPASEAAALGVALDGTDEITVSGFTGDALVVVPASVDLQISHGGQSFQWSAVVGFARFAKPDDEMVLLGHAGCLEFFRATFDGDKREVELVPTPAFPGSVR